MIITLLNRVVAVQVNVGTDKTIMLKTIKNIVDKKYMELLGVISTKLASEVFNETVGANSRIFQSFVMQYVGGI